MTLRVSRTKRAVIVTMPMRCGIAEAGLFLNRHLDWVRNQLGNVPQPAPFTDGMVVPVRGALHRVSFTGQTGSGALIEVVPNRVRDEGPDCALALLVHGRKAGGHRYLRDWLIGQARADLDERVRFHAQALGLRPKKICVRDQTSRWGSCSTTGMLSFSWRLILAPPLVLDYVAAHEVAHLAEMNHGPNFWALVRKAMPQMDEAKVWLQHYGSELHRYGAEH